jgi:hypothetical protein
MSHHHCPLHCCRRRCTSRVPAQTASRQRPRAARFAGQAAAVESTPPRPLSSLAACALRRVGAMRWHAPACRVASPLPISVQLARANDVQTNALHIASTQGRYHCDVAVASCYARVHTRRSTAAPSRHLPLSLLAQALPHAFSCRSVRGIATIPWGSMFLSSDHWALTASRAMMERCARRMSSEPRALPRAL